MVFENGVKNIQAAAYNGERTVLIIDFYFLFQHMESVMPTHTFWFSICSAPIRSSMSRECTRKSTKVETLAECPS